MIWDQTRALNNSEYRELAKKWCAKHKLDPSLVPTDGYVRQVGKALAVQVFVQNPDAPEGILYDFDEDKPKTEEVYVDGQMPFELLVEE